jgi:hypothetical protein
MEKVQMQNKFIYSIDAGEGLTAEDFAVELFDYNEALDCEGAPKIVIKNFDDLIQFLEEQED